MQKTSEGNSRKFKIIGLGAAALVLVAAIVVAVIMLSNPHLAVPGKYRTIQSAIDAARDGDVIIVQPGVYYEQIDFLGKNITVQSTDPENAEIVESTVMLPSAVVRVRVLFCPDSQSPAEWERENK